MVYFVTQFVMPSCINTHSYMMCQDNLARTWLVWQLSESYHGSSTRVHNVIFYQDQTIWLPSGYQNSENKRPMLTVNTENFILAIKQQIFFYIGSMINLQMFSHHSLYPRIPLIGVCLSRSLLHLLHQFTKHYHMYQHYHTQKSSLNMLDFYPLH